MERESKCSNDSRNFSVDDIAKYNVDWTISRCCDSYSLFNIYINDLVSILTENKNINTIFYADDLAPKTKAEETVENFLTMPSKTHGPRKL